jgi:hypothetical protein
LNTTPTALMILWSVPSHSGHTVKAASVID